MTGSTAGYRPLSMVVAVGIALMIATPRATALQCHVGTIKFYPEGGIRSCEIEGDHEFLTAKGHTVRCRSGAVVSQHPGGALESCAIAVPHDFGPTACPGPGRVVFKPDGSVSECGEDGG